MEAKRAQSRDQQQRGGPQGMGGGPMGGMQGALSQPAQPYGAPYQQGKCHYIFNCFYLEKQIPDSPNHC